MIAKEVRSLSHMCSAPYDLFTMLQLGGQPPSAAMMAMNQLTTGSGMAGGAAHHHGHHHLSSAAAATVKRRKKSTAMPPPKKMFEEAQMVRRVKAYLSNMKVSTRFRIFLIHIYDRMHWITPLTRVNLSGHNRRGASPAIIDRSGSASRRWGRRWRRGLQPNADNVQHGRIVFDDRVREPRVDWLDGTELGPAAQATPQPHTVDGQHNQFNQCHQWGAPTGSSTGSEIRRCQPPIGAQDAGAQRAIQDAAVPGAAGAAGTVRFIHGAARTGSVAAFHVAVTVARHEPTDGRPALGAQSRQSRALSLRYGVHACRFERREQQRQQLTAAAQVAHVRIGHVEWQRLLHATSSTTAASWIRSHSRHRSRYFQLIPIFFSTLNGNLWVILWENIWNCLSHLFLLIYLFIYPFYTSWIELFNGNFNGNLSSDRYRTGCWYGSRLLHSVWLAFQQLVRCGVSSTSSITNDRISSCSSSNSGTSLSAWNARYQCCTQLLLPTKTCRIFIWWWWGLLQLLFQRWEIIRFNWWNTQSSVSLTSCTEHTPKTTIRIIPWLMEMVLTSLTKDEFRCNIKKLWC